jgi:uncharacterized membrane protein/protein-disulfide isomerase
MEIRHRLLIIRCTALVALATSAALMMDYLRPEARLCMFDFDCDEVLSSRFSKVAGVPLPVFGMLAFAAMLACSLSSQPRWGRLLRYLALAASLAGLTLIALQVFVLHSICPFCLLTDCCALVIAYAAFGWRADALPALTGRVRHLWLGAALAALALGAALGTASSWLPAADDTTVPPEVSAHWVPDKVTIVEVVDFQCFHCRVMHRVLTQFLHEQGKDLHQPSSDNTGSYLEGTQLLHKQGKDLHFVRIVAPMPAVKHPQARDAARAYLCAQAQGKGEKLADDLFNADDLSPSSCEKLAVALGVDKNAYRTCVASAETEQQIDTNVDWVKKACPKGLPCLWVQEQRLSGVSSIDDLRRAVALAQLRLHASAH